jgi:hypothetical protein
VLGVLDAAASLAAVLIFMIGVLVLGGVDSSADLRVMLTLGALWFVVPVLAGAARPLRRPPTRTFADSWDRATDFVIGSLVGAWAVQKLVLALPGLRGMDLAIAHHADTAAFFVLGALALRARRQDDRVAPVSEAPGRLRGRRCASVLRVAAPGCKRAAHRDLRLLRLHRRRHELAAMGGSSALRRPSDPRGLRGAPAQLAAAL